MENRQNRPHKRVEVGGRRQQNQDRATNEPFQPNRDMQRHESPPWLGVFDGFGQHQAAKMNDRRRAGTYPQNQLDSDDEPHFRPPLYSRFAGKHLSFD